MTDPSKERIAAALRLANAVDKQIGVPEDLCPLAQEALKAYRATLPRIRSRAEVDADIAAEVRRYANDSGRGPDFEVLNRLCAEPTDSGPSSVDTPDPPPVPVSPAGADLLRKRLRDIHEICDCYASIDGERQLEIWNLSAPDYPSGPPGVAAAKESTDNAAALEGAANCEVEKCSCEESLVLRAEIVDLRRCLTWLDTRGGLGLETHSRIRRVLGPIRETDL